MKNKVDRLRVHWDKIIQDDKIEGGGFIIKEIDGTIHEYWSELGKVHFTGNTQRPIYSATKPITATCILQLVEQGLLSLNDKVSKYIEYFDNEMYGEIEVIHLLTHTSGLEASPHYWLEPFPKNQSLLYKENDWIKAALSGKIQCKTGTEYAYCSIGFNVLGKIIELVSSHKYTDYCMENIFKTIDMKDSHFDLNECMDVYWTSAMDRNRISEEMQSISAINASGGLISTANDLIKFTDSILQNNGELIKPDSRNHFYTNYLTPNTPAFYWGANISDFKYSAGWALPHEDFIDENVIWHEGAGRCAIAIDKKREFSIVFFVPSDIDWVEESVIIPKDILWNG